MDEALDGKTGRIVAYFSENRTDNRRDRRFIQAGNLPGDNDLPSGSHHFAGHTGEGVMGKAFIQHTVGNEVAQLIRMPFRNRFGGIKLIHGILLYRS